LTLDERIDKSISLLYEGAIGKVMAIQEANQLLEQLRLEYPDYPLAEACHGSIMLLIARDETNPLERLKWARNGLELLDKAVAAAPNDSRIRYLRGRSAYRLPEEYFQRTRTVIEDYSFLIEREPLQEGILGANDYTRITYELGEAYRRIDLNEDAARCWTKLEQQTQDPEFRQLLRLKLQSLEGEPAIEHIQANDSLKSILLGRVVRAVSNSFFKLVEKEIKTEDTLMRYKKDEEKKKEDLRKPRKKEEEKKKEDLRKPRKKDEEKKKEDLRKPRKKEEEKKKEDLRKPRKKIIRR
jgi:hypothetical protein